MKKILLILAALTVSAAAFAQKITTVARITSGNKYYIGATTGENDYYFYVDGSSKTESIGGLAKTDKSEAVALTFTAVTDGWTIQFDNDLYLGLKNAKDNGKVQVMDGPVVWTIEEDTDKGLLKLHPNDYYLQKYNSGTQFGSYKATQTNVWLESAGSTPVLADLDSLVIKGKAEKMEYELGEAFDPAGLEVWGIYNKTVKHDSTSQIKSGITWTLDPETFEEASDNASVTIVASFKEFTTADTTITGIKVNPVARKEFSFVAGKAADSDPAMFAITWGADGSSETVKMSKKEDDIYVAEILPTVDSVVLVRCATGATDIIWDGEGKNVWNQTGNYLLSDTMYFGGWVEETNLFILTTEPPKPVEAKYYAKNNWNGEDWTWKEMTKSDENVYTLERVVFGGTGVNINTKEEDTDAKWFDLKKMTYVNDTIQKMDTVRFVLTISQEDTVLTATLLGRPAPVWPEDAPTTAPAAPTVDGASILGAALTTSYAFEPLDWPGAMPKLLTFESGETIYYMSKMTWQIYTNWAEDFYDMSGYNTLHVDLYPATGTEVKITFECLSVGDGGQGYKNSVVKTLTAGQWNALDIALSEFPALNSGAPYDFSDIRYFILEGYNAEQTALTVGNVYFYSDPTALPKGHGTGITVNGRKYGFPVRLVEDVK